MSSTATGSPSSGASNTRDRYAFTVEDYHRLIAADLFDRTDRVELIRGELVMMPPIGPEHSSHTMRITNSLPGKLGPGLWLRMGEPLTLAPDSEPQPDAAVVRARDDAYRSSHPGPKDVLLVIEVADTSAAFDTQEKAHLYSQAGIGEYWILDVSEGCLRVFTEPSAKGFKRLQVYEREDRVRSISVEGLELDVRDWMP